MARAAQGRGVKGNNNRVKHNFKPPISEPKKKRKQIVGPIPKKMMMELKDPKYLRNLKRAILVKAFFNPSNDNKAKIKLWGQLEKLGFNPSTCLGCNKPVVPIETSPKYPPNSNPNIPHLDITDVQPQQMAG